jgi:calcineurin-like phosphoesterase family protein
MRKARVLLLASLAATSCGGTPTQPAPSPTPIAGPSADPDPIIAAAGDIACGTGTGRGTPCRQMETSELLVQSRPAAVLSLGDNQYESGEFADYQRFYDVSWGRLKAITRPAPGNHDYATTAARGYFDYFAGVGRLTSEVTGDRNEGWYSFDVGTWHLIALNSNCASVGGCGANSRQMAWLRQDLQRSRANCTLAYWHHPRFGSGQSRDDRTYQPFWEALYEFGVDVVLVGHEHSYERFAPQTPTGQLDRTRGIREFVVGTGGHSFQPQGDPLNNSEIRNNSTFGVLRMRLRPTSYEWKFEGIPGSTFTDTGGDTCH